MKLSKHSPETFRKSKQLAESERKKEPNIVIKDFTKGELWEETLRIDAEHQKYLEDCQRKAEEEKRKAVEEIKKINSDIAEVRYGKHNKKPKQQVKLPYAKAGVIVNLKNGKVRKPKKCEVGLTILDPYSDPSLEDGEPVFTKEGKVIKHGRKAKKD